MPVPVLFCVSRSSIWLCLSLSAFLWLSLFLGRHSKDLDHKDFLEYHKKDLHTPHRGWVSLTPAVGWITADVTMHIDTDVDKKSYFRPPEFEVEVAPHFTGISVMCKMRECG